MTPTPEQIAAARRIADRKYRERAQPLLHEVTYEAALAAIIETTAKEREVTTFKRGDLVEKKSGAEWHGRVVGEYSTDLTSEGYCVESIRERGSVQLCPVAALRRASDHMKGQDDDQ